MNRIGCLTVPCPSHQRALMYKFDTKAHAHIDCQIDSSSPPYFCKDELN